MQQRGRERVSEKPEGGAAEAEREFKKPTTATEEESASWR
jgi:hypothetical protein